MTVMEALGNPTIIRRTETETICRDANGGLHRFDTELENREVIKDGTDRMFLEGYTLCVMSKKPRESTCLGDYLVIPLESTQEVIEKTREKVLEMVLDGIRKDAKLNPEFYFIEKENLGKKTIGLKVEIPVPTVNKWE